MCECKTEARMSSFSLATSITANSVARLGRFYARLSNLATRLIHTAKMILRDVLFLEENYPQIGWEWSMLKMKDHYMLELSHKKSLLHLNAMWHLIL